MNTQTERPHLQLTGGNETILLVDDEESLRNVVNDFLAGPLGYNLLSAGTAEEALRVAESYPGTIDLLLTDVLLPGISGSELAEKLLSRDPKLKVLYMSGYPDHTLESYGVSGSNFMLLQKPFTIKSLAAKLREILDKDEG